MTKFDICNMALAYLGSARAITTFSDNLVEANLCNRFYDIARKTLLIEWPWQFAKMPFTVLTATTETNTKYNYVYEYPDDCLRIISIGTGADMPGFDYDYEEIYAAPKSGSVKRIVTDLENAYAEYITDVENVDLFPAYFANALAWRVAGMLGTGISKDAKLAQNAMQMESSMVEKAKYLAALEQQKPIINNLGYVRARHAAVRR